MEITRENPDTIKIQFRGTAMSVGKTPQASMVKLVVSTEEPTASPDDLRLFQGPGEYETAGIMIDGVMTGNAAVSYHVVHDGYQIACLALHDASEVTDDMIEHLMPSSVLCLWSEAADTVALAALVARFEAQIVIPVLVTQGADKLVSELQLKAEPTDRLKLGSKDFLTEQPRLIELT